MSYIFGRLPSGIRKSLGVTMAIIKISIKSNEIGLHMGAIVGDVACR